MLARFALRRWAGQAESWHAVPYDLASGVTMWTLLFQELPDGQGLQGVVRRAGTIASFAEVIDALPSDATLRTTLCEALGAVRYHALRWETPAVTRATLGRAFECVVLDSPWLAERVDASPFRAHFVDTDLVVSFPSLGHDAILIAPCPVAPLAAYGHLAAFLREAPQTQRHALWQHVGQAMQRRVGDRPVWLSTAGGGVAWLHVRLDDRPKYYGYAKYRELP